MLLENISLHWIVIPFVLAAFGYSRIRRSQTGDKLRDSLHTLQVMATMLMIAFMVLWLLLPSSSSFSTFGYPETADEVNTPEKVLKLMQKYNHAISRITEVLYWTLFLLAFWFMGTVMGVANVAKQRVDKSNIRRDETAS